MKKKKTAIKVTADSSFTKREERIMREAFLGGVLYLLERANTLATRPPKNSTTRYHPFVEIRQLEEVVYSKKGKAKKCQKKTKK